MTMRELEGSERSSGDFFEEKFFTRKQRRGGADPLSLSRGSTHHPGDLLEACTLCWHGQ